MDKLSKKLILALILAFSFLQLSFAFLMHIHADSMGNCVMNTHCVFESYVDETDAVIFTPLLFIAPILSFFFIAKPSGFRHSFLYSSPPLQRRQFLKGIIQRE
ncbi:hypothetical protein IPG41_05120 [Candidatus Peregrinibacteria bacterium]|nr:MAG: hypothetical protein IPG41_05120 [Candidatus Peregrinibacteria bacterium]